MKPGKLNKALEDLLAERNPKDEKESSERDRGKLSAKAVTDALLESVDELFHDKFKNGYAKITDKEKTFVYAIKSKAFSEYASRIVWEEFEQPLGEMKDKVFEILEAKAKYQGVPRKLWVRVGWDDKKDLLYDLGDGRAVRINASGWKIQNNPPPIFQAFPHQEVQVEPRAGGKLSDVFKYLNFSGSTDAKILLASYLVSVLIPDIPRPVLVLHGSQGSAKSTTLRVLKRLIDPSSVELMKYPRKPEEFVQILSHHFMVCFDNLTKLSDDQSDDLCMACTGQAFSKRSLYTNDEDVLYQIKRALAFNGINLVATKPDLLDRCMLFELPAIDSKKRTSEQKFWDDFDGEKPFILGAVFDCLASAMKVEPSISIQDKPRLADFAVWGAAFVVGQGMKQSAFLNAYQKNIEAQNEEAIEGSVIAQVIMDFMKDTYQVKETAKVLHDYLFEHAKLLGLDKDPDFPKSFKWLWKKIKIVKTNLQKVGIDAEYLIKVRPREIELTNRSKAPKNVGGTGSSGKAKGVTFPSSPTSTTPPVSSQGHSSASSGGGGFTATSPSGTMHTSPKDGKVSNSNGKSAGT